MKHLAVGLCLVVLASLCAAPADATLIGDTVTGQFDFALTGTFFGPTSTFVHAGPEFTWVGNFQSTIFADLGASTVTAGLYSGFTGAIGDDVTIILSDLDWVGDPTGVIVGLELVSNDFGGNLGAVSFTDHSITINIKDHHHAYDITEAVTYNIITNHDIPEPTTMTLLGMGAVGMITQRRRVVC